MTERRAVAPAGVAPIRSIRWTLATCVALLVVGASWTISALGTSENRWAIVATLAVAIGLSEAIPASQRLMPRPGIVPAVLLATLAAVYGCVPETDHIPLIAIPISGLFAVEVVTDRILRLSWHAAFAGLVLWAGVFGAVGRPSALVGALFAWWPMMLVPAAAALSPDLRSARETHHVAIATGAVVAALVVARTGALAPTIRPAIASSGIAIAGSVLWVFVIGRRARVTGVVTDP